MIQENGEEILTSDPPRIRYSAGILFPQGIMSTELDDKEEKEEDINIQIDENIPEIEEQDTKASGASELLQDSEELINLSNAFRQSAMSFTAAINNNDEISVKIAAGKYTTVTTKDSDTGKTTTKYCRNSIFWDNSGKCIELPSKKHSQSKYEVILNDENDSVLEFWITYRYSNEMNESHVYTFSLVNSKKIGVEAIKDDECFFQSEFSIFSVKGFAPLPEAKKLNINDDDYDSNQLLYRNVKNYAIGHGCAVDWEEKNGKIFKAFTTVFPAYEIKPIVPNNLPGVSLDMYKMSDLGDFKETTNELYSMCEMYHKWIQELKTKTESLNEYHHRTAERHLKNCLSCYERMVEGLELLKDDVQIRKAFQYMNRAMLLQQLHYNLPLQEWEEDGHGKIKIIEMFDPMPDINDSNTWFDNEQKVYGKWRPFQLAFILINLKSMSNKECLDRKLVDLIWFPTGGGKTEAYLGLSAYTIFMRKLKSFDDQGTAILMRYTLRLLTAQQYERAASMICACEIIRNENQEELGKKRITIGLWVGSETTPNSMNTGDDSAVKKYEKLYKGTTDENPFIILKCPWCGARMGVVQLNSKTRRLPGYKKTIGRKKEIIFQCENEKCDFSKDDFILPLLVVDEAIYEEPPTLLIGTVDKFAMLPYKPKAQKIFGIINGERKAAPELIIQDELHLISGPLGSMVGHYEILINELCTDRRAGKEITPKIIASTATISRAKDQCNALYNCGKNNVVQFPPSGIDAGNSFFAKEDKEAFGRKYVGVFAPASSSNATTSIRLYASLLYAARAIIVDEESLRDPYWTNLGYFNSLRELGQTATWVYADIDEYLHTIYKRRHEDKEEEYKKNSRYIYRFEELTSRIRSDKIPLSLQNLGIKYEASITEKRPIDICLATNMISVGVDVPRLGLMTVNGQPKATAEYIQATSRVGRESKSPGLIFTVYNPARPRDKSHYEQFKAYHSRIYCYVEPTSVTPFSAPLRERALHAILIGLVRFFENEDSYEDPKKIPSEKEIDNFFAIIEKRVEAIDESEQENTMIHLDEILREWKKQSPQKYQDFNAGEVVPLMYPAGTMRNVDWGDFGMPTPTSMRSVDASCEAYVLQNEYSAEE